MYCRGAVLSDKHIGPSFPLRRGSPMTITHLFFLMEVGFMWGTGRLILGNISNLDGLWSWSLFGSTSRPSYLLYNSIWEGWVVTEEMCLLHRAGTCCHSLLSLKSPHSARWRDDSESSVACVLSAWQACPREGRVWFQESTSFSDSRIPLNLLTSSWS